MGVDGTARDTGDHPATAENRVASFDGLLAYAYDTDAVADRHIVVRAVDHLDYTPGGYLYSYNFV